MDPKLVHRVREEMIYTADRSQLFAHSLHNGQHAVFGPEDEMLPCFPQPQMISISRFDAAWRLSERDRISVRFRYSSKTAATAHQLIPK